ncbi:hypothetical protein [Glycomyces tarimensis]
MTAQDRRPNDEITIADRIRLGDLLWFTTAAALVAATPWMFMDSAEETVVYRSSGGVDTETSVPLTLAFFLLIVVAWTAAKAFYLLRGPVVAKIDAEGLRLFSEGIRLLHVRRDTPSVDLPWNEVQRLIVWRQQTRILGLFPGWRTRLGVEKTGDYYTVSQKEPSAKERASKEHRENGSPVRLSQTLLSRSVGLSPLCLRAVAEAVADFAPDIEVVDERRRGKTHVIKPRRSREPD